MYLSEGEGKACLPKVFQDAEEAQDPRDRQIADPSTTVADMEEQEVTTDHNTDHSYTRDTGLGFVEPCVNPSCQTFAMEITQMMLQ